MQKHEAYIGWSRGGVEFIDQRYSREHEWRFDGGATIKASSSPANVPEPYSVPEAVDPEEALVAAVSSCHMLWFLSIAAKNGFVVDSYEDGAYGIIKKTPAGRGAFSEITLRPRVLFSGPNQPSDKQLEALHGEAHNECFIANSLSCDVVVTVA